MIGQLLTMRAAEVARELGVSPKTVYAWAKAGQIPHIRISQRSVIFHRAAFEEWLRGMVRYDTAKVAVVESVDLSVQGEREDVEPLDGNCQSEVGRAQGAGIAGIGELVARAQRLVANDVAGHHRRG